MKKRTIYFLIVFGLMLFIPFYISVNAAGFSVPDYWLRMLGLGAMVGAILLLLGLLNLSTVFEFKIVVRKKSVNE